MSRGPRDAGAERVRADSRRRVLEVLRASPDGGGVQQVAARTGLHPNTVRFHLERLEDDGLVTRQVRRSGGPGRPSLTYLATPVPDANREHRDFARLAEVLAQVVTRTSPDPRGAAIEAGRSWAVARTAGRVGPADAAGAIDELTGALAEVGFAPAVVTDEADGHGIILQRHCPFLEVAQSHQEVVCSVHLGLMRGVLERLEAPVTMARLIPFASPAGCEAHLAADGVGPSGA